MHILLLHTSEKSQQFEVNLKRFEVPYTVTVMSSQVNGLKFDEYTIPDRYSKFVNKIYP